MSENHSRIYAEFFAGKFDVPKNCSKYPALASDQCHEQSNAAIRESGGAVGTAMVSDQCHEQSRSCHQRVM